jgi:predicted RNase H-like HicB family nuclease
MLTQPTLSSVASAKKGSIAEWIETAQSLNRPIPEPKGKLSYA